MGNGCCKGGKKIDLISPALCQFAVNVRFGKAAGAALWWLIERPVLRALPLVHCDA
jgi:hypothetical protein